MKRIKHLGALIVSFAIVLSIIVPVGAVNTNDSTVFLKQNTSSTCTLSSAAMMLRRRAILDGSKNWISITESNLKPTAWVTGQGARLSYTYNGVSVTSKGLKSLSESKREYFISMLSAHPEGIVVYNHSRPHAVLLTDYDPATDTFYCADPSTSAPSGRIKFLDSKIPGDTQDSKINNIDQIWYIKSGKTIPPITVVSQDSGEWRITVPANYKLLCYANTTDTRNSTYIKAQSGRYVLSCTKSAILSNGKTRYFFVSGDKKSLWFDYDSNYMSVTESPGETSQKQYTVYFDPNGGSVPQTSKTVPAGGGVGSMPTPTREGYTFLGWCTNKNTSGLVLRTGDEMYVEEDTTLYATWKEVYSQPIADGLYSLAPKCAEGLQLDVAGGSSDDMANVQIYGSNGTDAQKWEFTYIGNGYYRIICIGSGKALDVANGSTSPETNVQQYTPNGTNAQQWVLRDAGDGYYYLSPRQNTNLRLDVSGGGTSNGTNVQVYTANSTDAQKWKLTTVSSNSGGGTGTSEDSERWTEWSEWSTEPAYVSDTRQVETRIVTEQVKVSEGYTEYRYVGYVTNDGEHDCWCETYLRSRFGSANLQYSAWSTTRYSPEQSRAWTCGNCGGSHIGAHKVGSDGRSWWYEYILPDDGYWWEESRTVDAQYETREVTQYCYRDRI